MQSNRNSEGSEKKKVEIREGRRGIRRAKGVEIFIPPVVGYRHFLESPLVDTLVVKMPAVSSMGKTKSHKL